MMTDQRIRTVCWLIKWGNFNCVLPPHFGHKLFLAATPPSGDPAMLHRSLELLDNHGQG
jgi:hypothetical protein